MTAAALFILCTCLFILGHTCLYYVDAYSYYTCLFILVHTMNACSCLFIFVHTTYNVLAWLHLFMHTMTAGPKCAYFIVHLRRLTSKQFLTGLYTWTEIDENILVAFCRMTSDTNFVRQHDTETRCLV